ncbi:hypothetical protein UPYG_G00081700 [Umbra pygmaea]|uniref:Uncharacterized protein n=1 Tax=Umbra pygmaea TaxID=75934 RepID=A0ABD0Y183_UMBPY
MNWDKVELLVYKYPISDEESSMRCCPIRPAGNPASVVLHEKQKTCGTPHNSPAMPTIFL